MIGQVVVDGVINARHYAYQGVPFMPTFPGVSWSDLLRAMQQAAQSGQRQKAPNAAAPKTNPSEAPPAPAEPLADPGENR